MINQKSILMSVKPPSQKNAAKGTKTDGKV